MTLLIAILLLHHMGYTNEWAYIGTVVLWVAHVAVHDGMGPECKCRGRCTRND